MPECWISCFEGCLDTVEMGSLSLRGNLGDKGYKREVGTGVGGLRVMFSRVGGGYPV